MILTIYIVHRHLTSISAAQCLHPLYISNITIYFQSFHNLDLSLASTLNSLCLGTVNVVIWDPALIVCLLCHSTSCNSRSISTNDRDLFLGRKSWLGASGRTFGTLTTFSTTLCLWEERFDPGLVYEVNCTEESREEEEIQENAMAELAWLLGGGYMLCVKGRRRTLEDRRC